MGEQHPGRPQTVTTKENAKKGDELIRATRQVTMDEISNKLGISHGPVYTITHKDLKLKKKKCVRLWQEN